MLLKLIAIVSVALTLAACGGSKQAAAPRSDLPPGCTVAEVDGIVAAFLTHPQIAPTPLFQLYATSESDGEKFLTRRRSAALKHLRARQAAGEKQRLIQLRVAPQDINHVRITFKLTRYAPDFARRKLKGRIANGTGTIDCAHQKVAAWSVKGP